MHDGKLDIATGRNRKETSWKNREWLWSELVDKLSTTHKTAETHAVYINAEKPRQDEIKDVGGYVCGYITGGRRKAGNILHRQAITLDIDFANKDFWEDFILFYGCAAVIYSTHKHSPEAPRLRLIIPLDRSVRPDEYKAISRCIAGILNIELFDPTTFQPERLMYWPSTSKDGEFIFEYQDGPWLKADDILNSYQDWKDSSAWPVSSKEDALIIGLKGKQQDPLEKGGIIGGFCKTYNIHEVIEAYLSDVYDACDVDNRYTYKEGSTSAGLVVYDDVFAYSHHSTDPTSGKLCNSYDFVRLHKFGLRDEIASNKAMEELAKKDKKVKKLMVSETLASAKYDFKNELPQNDTESENDDWKGNLDVDRKGIAYSTISNVMLILENDPHLKGCLAEDTFNHQCVVRKSLPWRKLTLSTKLWGDVDDSNCRHYLEHKYKISNATKIADALAINSKDNAFHPVMDYLQGVNWDGINRIDSLFIDYLGAADTPYIRAVTRKTLVAAVARIFTPGVKVDTVLTLIGKQGIGKSTIIKKLGKHWFSDSFNFKMLQTKEAYEQIQGVWIVEMGELAGHKKADVEGAKQFISKPEDRFRVPFTKRTANFPRQCIFIGTTNNRDFLQDPSGNRRYWPVDTLQADPTKDVFSDLTTNEVNQVWAEAVHMFSEGEDWHLSKELEIEANKIQDSHMEIDERAGFVQKYLDTLLPENWHELDVYKRRNFLAGDDILETKGTVRRNRVCVAELWCEVFMGDKSGMTKFNTKPLHVIMRKMDGWEERNSKGYKFEIYGNQKAYYRQKSAKTVHKN